MKGALGMNGVRFSILVVGGIRSEIQKERFTLRNPTTLRYRKSQTQFLPHSAISLLLTNNEFGN